ncbi:hypothetical protein [Hymenobacter sp. B1770]|uniref:hypothetical protein n=1 Tax=Hymenobacter sp. B1770 TaxID=1718788 RepID=UPI003CEF3A34
MPNTLPTSSDSEVPEQSEAELQAERQRRHHVAWGIAAARLGHTPLEPQVRAYLHGYIVGELTVDQLEALCCPSEPATRVLATTVTQARFLR